ncbi:MAG: hypothetical protein RLZZ299_2377 [Pseudomonadota bacterium]
MSTLLGQLVRGLGARVDDSALPMLAEHVFPSTREVRARLRHAGAPWLDPDGPELPAPEQLRASSERAIGRARGRVGWWAAASTAAGPWGVAPERLGTLLAVLRLAQELAVIHGFDPESESGRQVALRAVAAGLEIELPTQGPGGARLQDARRWLADLRVRGDLGAWMFGTARGAILTRALRVIPGLSAGHAAWTARDQLGASGERMRAVFAAASAATPFAFHDERPADASHAPTRAGATRTG